MENKNIDMKIISEAASRYKNVILNLSLILAALLISYRIYSVQQDKIFSLIRQKDAQIQINEMLSQISVSETKYIAFRDYLDKKAISSVIGTFGALAAQSSVEIASVRPEREESTAVFTKYPFFLSVKASDYHALGKFIAKVESYPDVYIVKSASISPVSIGADSSKTKIRADVIIYTVLVKK